MISIPMKVSDPIGYGNLNDLNKTTTNVVTSENISILNHAKAQPQQAAAAVTGSAPTMPTSTPAPTSTAVSDMTVPNLKNLIQKGQKTALDPTNSVKNLKACIGWNVTNPACDIDVSAFILGADGKVLGDDWFVFYGQAQSPDGSVVFGNSENTDRQYISIDLDRLNKDVQKIVFVLTINEAFDKKLNFSMVKDAYVRILNAQNQEEMVSFLMTDYYDSVISMMIGEIYLHNGVWKCNAVGNGVAKDLAGLCEMYGVAVA